MKTAKTVVLALLSSGWGYALSIDEHAARQTAQSFLSRADPYILPAELAVLTVREIGRVQSERRKHYWEVSTGRRVLTIENDTGAVVRYHDSRLANRAHSGPGAEESEKEGRPFYRSEQDLVAKARAKLVAIGWEHGPRPVLGNLPAPNSQGHVPRQIVGVRFFEMPNGYSTGETGNMVLIGLDSLSGELIQLQRFTGYSHEQPSVNRSRQDAAQIAASIIGLVPRDDQIVGPVYAQMPEVFQLSSRGQNLCSAKRLTLCYSIVTDRWTVLIAADSGEVLAKREGMTGSLTNPAGKHRDPIRTEVATEPSGASTLLWPVAGSVLLILGGSTYYWLRLSRKAS